MASLDLDRFTAPVPEDTLELIKALHKTQLELLKALLIIETALQFPHMIEYNQTRMQEMYDEYSKQD